MTQNPVTLVVTDSELQVILAAMRAARSHNEPTLIDQGTIAKFDLLIDKLEAGAYGYSATV